MMKRNKPEKPWVMKMGLLTAAMALTVFSSSLPVHSQEGASAEAKLQKAMGQDYILRAEAYKGMTFTPESWRVGDIISVKPYAVVTEITDQGYAAVRVWTGVFFRENNDLTATWDEIWVDSKGSVSNAHAEIDEYLPGYFSSASHKTFFIREYAGKMPWLTIPTDAEAKSNGWQPIPGNGIVNHYEIRFTEWSPEVADSSKTRIEEAKAVPASVPLIPEFVKNEKVNVPTDAVGHWAENFMIDLLQKEIIDGYEDHTIRPQLSVTRGEFMALLVRGIGKGDLQTAAKGYQDVESHWTSPWIGAAQAAGLLDAKPQTPSFQPDIQITRMDMVEFIARALDKFHFTSKAEALTFIDTAELSAEKQDDLAQAVGTGIIGGYPDGTFRPEGTLTRAEAFKVLSELISLLQK
jgi:hypothetical protein